MPGIGRKFKFWGAFKSKADARKKERVVHGFIKPVRIKGERRYAVLTRKRNPVPALVKIVARIPGKIEGIDYLRPKNASPVPDRKGVRGSYVPYRHEFTPGSRMFALADGSVIVKPPKGRKLFVLADQDGYAK